MNEPATHPAVVTIAAEFGTGEEAIGSAVAEQLGVEFLDRGPLPQAVAEEIDWPESSALIGEEPRPFLDRAAVLFARAPVVSQPGSGHNLDIDISKYRAEVEDLLLSHASAGAVVIGRAGAVVLRSVPGVLHVRLRGDRGARVAQIMQSRKIRRPEAAALVQAHDRARDAYGTQLYGVVPADPSLYHLIVDRFAFDDKTCVQTIVAASRGRSRAPSG